MGFRLDFTESKDQDNNGVKKENRSLPNKSEN